MKRFNSLNEDAKVVYLLTLCDLIVDRISSSTGYEVTIQALKACWEWVQSKNIKADQLYFYLENLDEKDILTYMQLEANKENEAVWVCIANSLAYIVLVAYQYEGERYLPETIECVDDETLESFWLNFYNIVNSNVSDKLLDYMVKNYSNVNKQHINILQIKQFMENNA